MDLGTSQPRNSIYEDAFKQLCCISAPLETDALVAVLALVAVELEVVVEDEAVLHVPRHLDPDGGRS